MKKTYIYPETTVYKVNVTSIMATSLEEDTGSVTFKTDETPEADFTDPAREDNNRNSVWENIW